ncbi:MAG: helix-turn-helix domain-containing protein [Fermentimonas sp.]|nr:helix-turn-helix domain-containing protein [Fermentimonas sp.]
MNDDKLSNWMDSQDVFRELRISPRTLQRWRITGMIPYSRINGICFYKKSDLVALLDRHYNGEKDDGGKSDNEKGGIE